MNDASHFNTLKSYKRWECSNRIPDWEDDNDDRTGVDDVILADIAAKQRHFWR